MEYNISCKDYKHLHIEEMRRIQVMEHIQTVRTHKVGFGLDLLSELAFLLWAELAFCWVGFGLGQFGFGPGWIWFCWIGFGLGQLWAGLAFCWVGFLLG